MWWHQLKPCCSFLPASLYLVKSLHTSAGEAMTNGKWINALRAAMLCVYCCISVAFESKFEQNWPGTIFNRNDTAIFWGRGTKAYFIMYWMHVSILFLPPLIHCCSVFHFSFLTGGVTPESKAAQILSRFLWFSAFCFLIVVMFQVLCHR